ncbi:hypothetical protein [Asticcacaulis taihuensis]|uniref:hypothetical protein n=1 Tax=Asticcacaulis taihuensis TaxID=260084 RepID=UPI0026F2D87C|nr:hypothetical protein [Asticcacaulis taihuensis]
MFGRLVMGMMLVAGGAQTQTAVPPAPVPQSSKQELEEFAKGCAAVYLMAADTARGDDLSQAMVRGASTVDYYRQSTGLTAEQVNQAITDMRDRLTERLARNPQPSLKELRANCDAAFSRAGG